MRRSPRAVPVYTVRRGCVAGDFTPLAVRSAADDQRGGEVAHRAGLLPGHLAVGPRSAARVVDDHVVVTQRLQAHVMTAQADDHLGATVDLRPDGGPDPLLVLLHRDRLLVLVQRGL